MTNKQRQPQCCQTMVILATQVPPRQLLELIAQRTEGKLQLRNRTCETSPTREELSRTLAHALRHMWSRTLCASTAHTRPRSPRITSTHSSSCRKHSEQLAASNCSHHLTCCWVCCCARHEPTHCACETLMVVLVQSVVRALVSVQKTTLMHLSFKKREGTLSVSATTLPKTTLVTAGADSRQLA